MPDNASHAIPEFEWCQIPVGEVEIEGKVFHVHAFQMAKYPVTTAQFQLFIDAPNGYSNPEWWVGLAFRSAAPETPNWTIGNHPRENVNWAEAIAFCRWLSAQTGQAISLPAEWEWQFAAQGEERLPYPWGRSFDAHACNTGENDIRQTTPVDYYPQGASPFGVMDMAGNVWEWCLNDYDQPENITIEGRVRRALRGGCWDYLRQRARCDARFGMDADLRSAYWGFRVSRLGGQG